jgi:hypothetical protein
MDIETEKQSVEMLAANNRRLQQLVAELLRKNELLRQQLALGESCDGAKGVLH